MYRPDSEGRLQIPRELFDILQYEIKNQTCFICMGEEERETYIVPKEKLTPKDKVLITRNIDSHGRLFIKSIQSFWGNSKEYLIYVQEEKIWILGII